MISSFYCRSVFEFSCGRNWERHIGFTLRLKHPSARPSSRAISVRRAASARKQESGARTVLTFEKKGASYASSHFPPSAASVPNSRNLRTACCGRTTVWSVGKSRPDLAPSLALSTGRSQVADSMYTLCSSAKVEFNAVNENGTLIEGLVVRVFIK